MTTDEAKEEKIQELVKGVEEWSGECDAITAEDVRKFSWAFANDAELFKKFKLIVRLEHQEISENMK